MSEKNVVDAIRRLLTRRGAWHLKTTGVAIAGIPDLICCYRGFFIAIEVKPPGGRPRPNQQRQLDLIDRATGLALCATSADQVALELDRIDQNDRP